MDFSPFSMMSPSPKYPHQTVVCSAGFTEVCGGGNLLHDFSPLSPQNFPCCLPSSLLHPHPNSILTLLYKTTLLSPPYWPWTCFCTFKALLTGDHKALLTGDHIIYHPNYDTFENESGPNNSFSGTTVVYQESPQQTRACGHPTSVP